MSIRHMLIAEAMMTIGGMATTDKRRAHFPEQIADALPGAARARKQPAGPTGRRFRRIARPAAGAVALMLLLLGLAACLGGVGGTPPALGHNCYDRSYDPPMHCYDRPER